MHFSIHYFHQSSFANHANLANKQFGQQKRIILRSENEAHKNFTSLLEVSKKVSKYSFFFLHAFEDYEKPLKFPFHKQSHNL